MEETNSNVKRNKILMLIFLFLGIFSLSMLIPLVQNAIIYFGELITSPSLHNRNYWRMWLQKNFLLAFAFFETIAFYFSSKIKVISENIKNKYPVISCVTVIISSICLFILAFESEVIWLDETFSLGLARHSIKEAISLTARDVHPPLYYIILRPAMILFNESIHFAKVVSVIPVVLILCVSNIFFSKEGSYKSSILFNLLLISTPNVLNYAIEIRMYSWCMLFCFLCCIFTYYIIKDGRFRYYLLYVISAVCGAYCHYWTAFGLAIGFGLVSLFSLKKDVKSIKYILISGAVGIALYLPWVGALAKQISVVKADYWIAPLTINEIIDFFLYVIPASSFLKLLSFLLLTFFFIKLSFSFIKGKNEPYYLFIFVLTPFCLIVSAIIICFLIRPVFISRYALPFIVNTIFFLVLCIKEFNFKKEFTLSLSLLCALFCIFELGWMNYNEIVSGINDSKFKNIISNNTTKNTIFIFDCGDNTHIYKIFAYYYPENRIYGHDIDELWTSVYLYDRDNLIDSIEDEKDLCLISSEGQEPLEMFRDCPNYKVFFDGDPIQLYFRKTE